MARTPSRRESIATLVVLGAIAIGLVGLVYFMVTVGDDPVDFTPDPIPTILADVNEVLTTVDPDITWCEGFAAGVVLKLYVDKILVEEPYTFPTEDHYQTKVVDCLERNMPNDPMPFGETRGPGE